MNSFPSFHLTSASKAHNSNQSISIAVATNSLGGEIRDNAARTAVMFASQRTRDGFRAQGVDDGVDMRPHQSHLG